MKLIAMCALGLLVGGGAVAAEPQDAMFVNQAAIGGMAEVAAGQFAASAASAAPVKAFATRMVSEHTANNQELTALALKKGLTPPASLDAEHQAKMTAMQAMPGNILDAAYVRDQVTGHTDMAAVMQKEIDSGSDPDIKAFAEKTLPVVKMHLQMAQQLAGGTAE